MITVVTVGTVQLLGGIFLCCIPLVQMHQRRRWESRQNKIAELENLPLSKLKEQSQLPFTHSVEHIGQPV